MSVIKNRAAIRLDSALAERGLVDSRDKAAELIREGKVLVNGSVAQKPSRQVKSGDQIHVTELPRYVSRGGLKLEGALSQFEIIVKGLRILDVGSSTGGFTDCLLQHGAKSVTAVDVGTNQLHERIRNDSRVLSSERTNIRDFSDPKETGFDLIAADVSFTSIAALASTLLALVREDGELIILVKPQFEVGHRDASKGKGIIKDPALWRESLIAVVEAFTRYGASVRGLAASVIRGTEGNVEFFYHFSNDNSRYLVDYADLIDREIENVISQSRTESD